MAAQTLSSVFERATDEAYVEFFLFPEESVQNDSGKLQEFLIQVNIATVSIIGDYLWQKESFQLKLDPNSSHFYGTLHYDVNLEDEWFTVHILQELTQTFPGLIARVLDQDGEFLLIESSEHIPDWAESDEICQGRVYICNGRIHLVGEFVVNGKTEASLREPMEVTRALELVRKYPERTVADSKIQAAVQTRIGKYPEKMLQNFHHSNLFLPVKVARMLSLRPGLLSAAVRAFHDKDSIDMQTARLMPNFSPFENLVKSRISFTKTLYAMLSSEEYYPDAKVQWKFPLPKSPEFKPHSLGAKLTLGFEILLARGAKARAGSNDDNLQCSPAWLRYEKKLTEYNYYHGLIEGSREYKKLQERAKSYFQSSVAADMEESVEDQAILQVQSLMSQIPDSDLDFISTEELLPDDDDSWMEMNVLDLESLLAAQFKSKISDQKLDQIPEKLKEFMSQMSDFTGVELPTDGSDHGSGDEDCGLDPIDFRADEFVSAMDKLLLELGKPANDFPLSEPSSEEDEANEKIKELEKKYVRSSRGGDAKMEELMGAMDEELEKTDVGKTFQSTAPVRNKARTKKKVKTAEASGSSSTSTPIYEPVDIDMNALTNILESFQSQEDPSIGPSANLLRNVGFDITKAAHK